MKHSLFKYLLQSVSTAACLSCSRTSIPPKKETYGAPSSARPGHRPPKDLPLESAGNLTVVTPHTGSPDSLGLKRFSKSVCFFKLHEMPVMAGKATELTCDNEVTRSLIVIHPKRLLVSGRPWGRDSSQAIQAPLTQE